ncbi:DNA-directed RNA polymerase subunit beta [Paenibacillus sp. TAB 01]|uniref:DNA-directed RNA polymerase subunit beta n=1 Tax=Paenibacillus sp. TAB 01 TaxID=3368988 RepID=UPI003752622D
MAENEEEKKTKKAEVRPKRWKRSLFLACKWLGIPFLCVVGLGAGMVIGYVYLGKRPMDEVYEFDTWRHIYDLVFSQT